MKFPSFDTMHLSDRLRASDVKRWHTKRTHRTQNVAEHSFRAMLIASDILERMDMPEAYKMINEREGGASAYFHPASVAGRMKELNRASLLNWLMWHDLPEVNTGDVISPTKRAMGTDKYDQFEKSVGGRFAEIEAGTPIFIKEIASLADKAEASLFIMEEGYGNDTTNSVTFCKASLIEKFCVMGFLQIRCFGVVALEVFHEIGVMSDADVDTVHEYWKSVI